MNNPMQIMSMLQNSQNPMGIIQQIYASHPKYDQVMQIIKGKSPAELEQYARNFAKSQNIDITQLASQFGLQI